MAVLALTASTVDDPCVDMVAAAIEARGARLLRLDSAAYPTGPACGWTLDDDGAALTLPGLAPGEPLDAVWVRPLDAGALLPDDLDAATRDACREQARRAVWSLLECTPVFTLDPPDVLQRAPYKPRQLELARAVGLDVPRSLLANDPRAVRAFAARCPGGLVVKLLDSAGLLVRAGDRLAPLPTRTVTPAELREPGGLDGLDLCPMLFQERVPKALELRLTIVGREVFAAAVDPRGADDWRGDPGLVAAFRPHRLPDELRARVLRLLDHLRLNFATVDMIVTPDGRHVFLEVNTVSYFDFVERATGLPIAAAVADLLLGRAPPRIAPARLA